MCREEGGHKEERGRRVDATGGSQVLWDNQHVAIKYRRKQRLDLSFGNILTCITLSTPTSLLISSSSKEKAPEVKTHDCEIR